MHVDKEELAALWRKGLPAKEIAERLGVRTSDVSKYRFLYGLPKRQIKGLYSVLDSNPEKKRWFIRNYPDMSNRTIGLYLGISMMTVYRHAKKYGLKKSELFWKGDLNNEKKR